MEQDCLVNPGTPKKWCISKAISVSYRKFSTCETPTFPFSFFFIFHYIFLELTVLVNADRVKRKPPSLLVEDSTTKKKTWNSLNAYRYRFTRFKKQQPEKFNSMTKRIFWT
jgi:hypothetical protein